MGNRSAMEETRMSHTFQPAEGARRLRLVRGCAPSHSAVDPRTEIAPPEALPYRPPRRAPSL
jgi:integrase/recombinase XerD